MSGDIMTGTLITHNRNSLFRHRRKCLFVVRIKVLWTRTMDLDQSTTTLVAIYSTSSINEEQSCEAFKIQEGSKGVHYLEALQQQQDNSAASPLPFRLPHFPKFVFSPLSLGTIGFWRGTGIVGVFPCKDATFGKAMCAP